MIAFIGVILFVLAVIAGVVAIASMMNDSNNRYPGWLLLVAMVMGILGYWMLQAAAHDHSRPDLKPWFESLRSRAGAYCWTAPTTPALKMSTGKARTAATGSGSTGSGLTFRKAPWSTGRKWQAGGPMLQAGEYG
jgi:hypothetical protein